MIKSLTRLLASSNSKHKRKQHFCMNYLQGFHSEESRDKHFKHCKDNEAVRIEMRKKGSKRGTASATRKGGGGVTSCIAKSGTRTRTKHDKPTRTSTKTKGVSCSCGQFCKNFRGLKLHQIKAKC